MVGYTKNFRKTHPRNKDLIELCQSFDTDEVTILGWFKEIWGAEIDKKLIEKLVDVSENYPIVLNLGLLQYKDENVHNDILKGMLETEKEALLQAHPKFRKQLENFNQIKNINKFKDYIDNTIKTMEIKN